jgi:hypothetical protein
VAPLVSNNNEYEEWAAQGDPPLPTPTGTYTAGDSVRVTILVTTIDAYATDTLHVTVRQLPRLDTRAIRDADPPCGSWSAHSFQDAADLYVVSGDPTSDLMQITPVSKTAPPVPRTSTLQCARQGTRTSEFATFLLGGVGDRADSRITLCFSGCRRRYELDPSRHTLAERAHVIFRLSDLREETRAGDQVQFRMIVEPAPANLWPLVVVRTGTRWPSAAWIPERIQTNVWDYYVNFAQGYPPGTEVHIFLALR